MEVMQVMQVEAEVFLVVVSVLLLIANYVSFSWALDRFFRMPTSGMPFWMKAMCLAAMLSMVIHTIGGVVFPTADVRWAGAAITMLLGSLALFWWSIYVTRKTKLAIAFAGERSDYVATGGPFSFVRHPLYASYMLCWLAGAVLSEWWMAWCAPPVMFFLYWCAARMEEKIFLSGPLRQQYAEYAHRTSQFFPAKTIFRKVFGTIA